ncbi:MAG: PAS domain S-box protein [Ignavibacteria bacterium]|jgi:PAS domain S-box-containing protein|nr:PAS domain S-box protein [Ignavibacteria bacterium]MCU7503385.1 PAS domain S-box protein [Ignavibacteria bacterium]MCU7518145.1 PAS domain S-box protein [Ignavibacteria bacterium]
MKFPSSTERQLKYAPIVISTGYALVSAAWIVVTDYLLAGEIKDPIILTHYQTYKGWFFILISAVLLYYFVRLGVKKIRSSTDALVISENKYRTLLEQASDSIILADKYAKIIEANSTTSQLLGYKKDEIINRSFKDFFPPGDLEAQPLRYDEILSGEIIRSDRRFVHKSGRIIDVEITAKMLMEGIVQAIIRDVSLRKEIEDRLRKSEEQYRLLFRENPHPMWVYDQATLRFLAVNNAAIEAYGFSQDEFLSMTIKNIRPIEDIPDLEDNIALTGRKDSQHSGPWRHLKKSGQVIFVEILSNNITFGSKEARLVLANDITEKKAALEALQDSEKRFRSLFEYSPISIWEEDFSIIKNHIDLLKTTGVTDFKDYLEMYPDEIRQSIEMVRVLDVNEATLELFEAEKKEDITGAFPRIAEEEDYRVQRESIIAISEGKTKFEIDSVLRTLKGKEVHTHIRWNVAEGFEQTYAKVLVTIEDITELKKTEEALRISNHELNKLNEELEERVKKRTEQLEAANKELEAFSYSVSHDLKAPLRAIDGFSQILLDDFGPEFNPEAKRFLNIISKNAGQMEQLIEDLLAFSKIYNREKNEVLINMNSLVASITEQFIKDNSGRKILFTIRELPESTGDRPMLQQVWINLVSNAVKFTKDRDEALIEIGGEKRGNEVVYYIKDNGTGFNMEYAYKLFGVFQRLHPSSEFEGTGVGLAIVQRILRRHEGNIWAEAEAGKGATFYFSLPIRKSGQERLN